MEELLMHLAGTARREGGVASQQLDNGMELLVYPLEEGGALVGLGYERDGAGQVRAEQVLRRRAQDMARLGAWLPALFADGSWYLLRRLPNASLDGATPLLSHDELAAAEELLQ
ncbi:hypothetical protein ACFOLJ_03100 [Rugamonas sp. CCM 8940]|uniref:hypothetical protein n=1 Tax=Rugamonas sp. CCM 8940 TaxID=2765359 RepID=UPI0018F5BDFB|nr:hypothetical protein [Rugamonas sp. CCM 8940]MBJ7311927.1 hypothetical protein [Rugamonas sp. CCM 8940]